MKGCSTKSCGVEKMKVGDLVKLADWCHHPGSIGTVVKVDRLEEIETVQLLVESKIQTFHPDDFYLLDPGD